MSLRQRPPPVLYCPLEHAITWLRDPSLDDADNLPVPEVLAAEIVEDLQAALEEFAAIAETLQQARGMGALEEVSADE